MEMTDEEFELLVLMYVQEPQMYPLSRAQELFDRGLFMSSGQFGYVEKARKGYPRGEPVCGVLLAQEGIDLVGQADPVSVARIWLDHDYIVAATGWILTRMSRDQLPGFLSHESREVREAALKRMERLSHGSDKNRA